MEKLYLLDKIIHAIKEWRSTNPKEEDKKRLYENVKKYYKRLKEACEKESKVYRLASDIEKDYLFCMAIGNDNHRQIMDYLRNMDKLTKKQKDLKRQICREVLRALEYIWKNL
jgi:hypothetical protein